MDFGATGKRKTSDGDHGKCPSKKPKIDPLKDGIRNGNKWNLLQSIVFELFKMLRSKLIDRHDDETSSQEKITDNENKLNNTPKEKTVFFENNSTKSLHNSEIINPKETIKLKQFKSTIQNSIHSLDELDIFIDKTENVKIQKQITLNTFTVPVENVEKIIQKAEDTDDKTCKKINDNCTSSPTKKISKNSADNESNKKIIDKLVFINRVQLLDLLKTVCFKGVSEKPFTKPDPCICEHCQYVDNKPNNYSEVNDNQFTTNFKPSFKQNSKCFTYGFQGKNSLCFQKSNFKYYWEKKKNYKEISKQNWLNELILLIKKNEETYRSPKKHIYCNNQSSEINIKDIMVKVYEAAEKIKKQLSLCDICNKSKLSSICDCSILNLIENGDDNKDNYNFD